MHNNIEYPLRNKARILKENHTVTLLKFLTKLNAERNFFSLT